MDPGSGRASPADVPQQKFPFSLVEHDHTVGHRVDTWQLMRDNDKCHAEAFPKAEDERINLGRGYRIETRRRLIQKEHRRVKAMARAMAARFCMPPLTSAGKWPPKLSNPTSLSFIHEIALRASTGKRVNSSGAS